MNATEISLKQIDLTQTNPREIYGFQSLKELAKSIEEHGVIQPILVRPKGKNRYELVCGERRFKASQIALKENIPVFIREMDDREALELQLVENLEREDVHPLHEAKAFLQLLNYKANTIANIALKIAKSQSYVVQRIQLNSLVDGWKELYLTNNEVTLSHALLICKLTQEDQNTLIEDAFDWGDRLKSVKELKDYINNRLLKILNNAPFDQKDAALVPEAGSCMNCSKRSGFNTLLFENIEEGNTCFDGACFDLKLQIHAVNRITTIIENQEDILLIHATHQGIPTKINALIESHKIPLYTRYEDFYGVADSDQQEDNKENESKKAIWVSGDQLGKEVFIKLTDKEDKTIKKSMADCSPEEQVIKIKTREVRSKEIDREKIQKAIIESLADSKFLNTPKQLDRVEVDTAMERLIIINSLNWSSKANVLQKLKLKYPTNKMSPLATIKWAQNITEDQMSFIIRRSFFDSFNKDLPHSNNAKILKEFATHCNDVPILDIEKAQKETTKKRQTRIKERIEKLQKNK